MSNDADKVAASVNKKLKGLLSRFDMSKAVYVGLPKDAQNYPDGTSVVMIGTVHEFGSLSGDIPERSFLRSTLKEKTKLYLSLLEEGAKNIIEGKTTLKKVLGKLGQQAAGDVKKKIVDLDKPALTKETIKRKGSSNPLVDTGHLGDEITYEVRSVKNA